MGRRYIGIEQLDRHYKMAIERLDDVINGDKTGISSVVNWNGGGSFISVEFANNANSIIERIEDASEGELENIYADGKLL